MDYDDSKIVKKFKEVYDIFYGSKTNFKKYCFGKDCVGYKNELIILGFYDNFGFHTIMVKYSLYDFIRFVTN